MTAPVKAPCKGCTDRTVQPNCHMSCPRYLAYTEDRQRLSAEKQAYIESIQARDDAYDYAHKRLNLSCKRRGRR